tara:strand:- start:814 stop:1002 length:189 start_codon:yes stop_codon:yes gene_type:complete
MNTLLEMNNKKSDIEELREKKNRKVSERSDGFHKLQTNMIPLNYIRLARSFCAPCFARRRAT